MTWIETAVNFWFALSRCGHHYCLECIRSWLNKAKAVCPLLLCCFVSVAFWMCVWWAAVRVVCVIVVSQTVCLFVVCRFQCPTCRQPLTLDQVFLVRKRGTATQQYKVKTTHTRIHARTFTNMHTYTHTKHTGRGERNSLEGRRVVLNESRSDCETRRQCAEVCVYLPVCVCVCVCLCLCFGWICCCVSAQERANGQDSRVFSIHKVRSLLDLS